MAFASECMRIVLTFKVLGRTDFTHVPDVFYSACFMNIMVTLYTHIYILFSLMLRSYCKLSPFIYK